MLVRNLAMVRSPTTYYFLTTVIVVTAFVATIASATNAEPSTESNVEADPTDPPATDNPRCKHPLFCRQRPMFGQRLRPLTSTTTPSTTSTTTRNFAGRFSARPNLHTSENLPQVSNSLQQNTKSRYSSRTTASLMEETGDPQTADIEDLKGSEERSGPLKRNRLHVTTTAPMPKRSSNRSTPSSSSAPETSYQTTIGTPIASTTRRLLPVTMARYRTNTAKTLPKATLSPEIDQEDSEKNTTPPTTVSTIADCPDGVCTTIRRIPGATVVVRKKKIRPSLVSEERFQVTAEPATVTEITSISTLQDNIGQTVTSEMIVTRKPFVSNRNQGLLKGRTSQRIRDKTITSTEKAIPSVFQEINTKPITAELMPRKQNPKYRKKVTTTTESPENTEEQTTQNFRGGLSNPGGSTPRDSLQPNKKCRKSCRGSTSRRPTTTPEPENYPTTLFPFKPLKQRNELTKSSSSNPEDITVLANANRPQQKYKTETESPNISQQILFSNALPLRVDLLPVTEQYVQGIAPTTENLYVAPVQNANSLNKELIKPKNALSIQSKIRTGKNGGERESAKPSYNFNTTPPANQFSNSHKPQNSQQTSVSSHDEFSGHSYSGTEVPFYNSDTKSPLKQSQKTPAHETVKYLGGYNYAKPATPFAYPTTARPKPLTTPMVGINSYIYPKPQISLLYTTTMKPIMQESTSFLPMLLRKKQEVLENTPIIGSAMTTVRNIINFITKPEDVSAKNFQHLNYQPPYQYPTTLNPTIPPTTYSPYISFPPYPPRNTFQKHTKGSNNGFKLKAKPRKNQNGFDENRTVKTPSGFDTLTLRTISSPRPFKQHTDEPYPFEYTKKPSSQYDTPANPTLKAEASTRHHHYRSPSRGKHVSHENPSATKTRIRPSRKRCQNKRCRSSRQNTIRSEEASMYIPVSSMVQVRGPKLRTKRQDSEDGGYVYPRPSVSSVKDSVSDSPVTTGYTASSNLPSKSTSDYSTSAPPGDSTSVAAGVSNAPSESFAGYAYSKPPGSSLSTNLGTSTTSSSSTSKASGASNTPKDTFTGYDYPKPSTTPPTTTVSILMSISPASLPSTTFSGLSTTPSSRPLSTTSDSLNAPEESFEGYDYPKPSGNSAFTPRNPVSVTSGGSTMSEESVKGYEYSKPAKPFLSEPGSSKLPSSENIGYDYLKPSDPFLS